MNKRLLLNIGLSVIIFLAGLFIGLAIGRSTAANKGTGTPTEATAPTNSEPVSTPASTPSAAPTETPAPTGTEKPTEAPDPTGAEAPTETPDTTGTEKPTEAPEPTGAETPTETPTPTGAESPTETPTPTKAPTVTPVPTKAPTATPVPTKAPTATPAPTAPLQSGEKAGQYYGKLKVTGRNLTDMSGNVVQLRGMSTHGLAWFPDYVNKDMFAQLKNWGANLIRLAMYTAEYGGYCSGGNKTNLKDLIDKGVKYATELDMYVIIDWHILSDSNPNTNKAEALLFFDEMSKKYAANEHVIYEICNEPNGGTSWADIKKYANEVIPVIRKNSPDAIIIVGTPTWSQEVDKAAADPVTGYDNIMYALHFYAATHRDDLRRKCENAAKAGLPIFVTEFGICDASGNGSIDVASANTWIALLDKYAISYANWSLCNKAESASFISSSCNKKSGLTYSDLSQSGKWVVDTLYGPGSDTALITPGPGVTPGVIASGNGENGQTEPEAPTPTPVPTLPPIILADVITGSTGLKVQESPNSWSDGERTVFQFSVDVVNTTGADETDWTRTLVFSDDVTIELANSWWWATATQEGNRITITPFAESHKTVPAGGTLTEFFLQVAVKKK